jgi:hypothetical protein
VTDNAEVMIFEAKESTEEWPPRNAVMFLLWLQRQLADVHPRCRNEVRIEIGHDSRLGSYIKLSHPNQPRSPRPLPQKGAMQPYTEVH